ncbi:MAG: GNAT family N-acetyltransferase [Nitrosospira sp.]
MTGSPLCEDCALVPELFKLLRHAMSNSDVVFFEGIQTSSPFSKLLTSKTPVCDFFYVVPHGPTYTRRLIELNSGAQFEDYLRTLGSKTREDVRRTRKNFPLKAGGAVTLIRYTQPEQAHELAAALAQVSRKTYQYHLLGLGLENTSEHVAHLRKTAANGWLRAYVLKIGDTPVAFGLGYRDSHTYYGHHIGYDPSLSKLQPGIYLHTEVMADLLADGIFRFDFLPGDSLYKQRMSNKSREERHYYLIPRGWPGTAYAAMLISMNFISEVIGRWLNKTGLKERVKRQVRILAVWRSSRRP